MTVIAKIYIQGELKRSETEFHTLLPALLSAGFQKEELVCVPHIKSEEITVNSTFNIYDPFLPRGKIPVLDPRGPHLPLAEILHMCNFVSVLHNAATLDLPDESVVLILDAKTVPRRDFHERLKGLLGLSWDSLSLAHHPALMAEDASYFADSEICEHEPTSPMTSRAIALRLSYVKNIVKTIMPFREPLDNELVFQTLIHKTKPQYVFPPLFDLRL